MNTILDFGYGLAHLVRNPHWNEKSHTPQHSQEDVKNMSHQIFENSSCFCCQDAAVPLWPLEKTAISSSLASLKTHSYEENIVYSSLLFSLSCQSINCSGLSLQSTWKMNRTSGLDRVLQDMNPCFNKIRSALSTATENQKLIHKASNGTTLSANCHCCCRNAGTPLCNLEAALAASSS